MQVSEELVELVPEEVCAPRVRLFSRGYSERFVPLSDVPVHHTRVHAELVVWGRWNSTRRKLSSLGSLESLYVKCGTPPSTAPLAESAPAFCMEIERSVIRMPTKPRRALRLLYVARYAPSSICSSLHIRPQNYSAFMSICRAMVINLRRRFTRA